MIPTDDAGRKALPLWTFLTEYFPDAILAMVRVSVAGQRQHQPDEPAYKIRWAREKSRDQFNTAVRHLWDHSMGNVRDTDGEYHLAKAAWRICAALQLQIERDGSHDPEPLGKWLEDPHEPSMAERVDMERDPVLYPVWKGKEAA